jgi:uncharacterized protein (TIRG00374 family)
MRPGARRSALQALPARNVVVGTVVGIPLGALFAYLAVRQVEWSDVSAALGRADAALLAGAVAAMLVVYTVQALRWRWLARADADLPRRTFLKYVLSGIAVNNVVPGRPGDLLRAQWLGTESGAPRSRTLATVVVDRASDVLALVAALAVGFGATSHPTWLRNLAVLAVAAAGVITVVLLVSRAQSIRRAADRRHQRGRLLTRAGRLGATVLTAMGRSVNRRDAVVAGALSVLAWTSWAFGAWLVARSLGIALSPLELALVTGVVNLGVAIPSSPGFVGTYQWLCVSVLGLFAVPPADAFAFAVLLHASWFAPTTVAGAALLVRAGASRLTARRLPGTVEPRARAA